MGVKGVEYVFDIPQEGIIPRLLALGQVIPAYSPSYKQINDQHYCIHVLRTE
jgi:hypothetical protein